MRLTGESATSVERIGERLHLVGTVHVDPASVALVKEVIHEVRPEVVGLELDQARLNVLQNPGIPRLGRPAGLSFLAMALLEKFAGRLTGSPPGREMLEAVEAARSVGARVELIDLPISTTISSLKRLPFGEKLRLVVDSLASLVLLPVESVDISSLVQKIESQILLFRRRYPFLSRLLIDSREEYMVKRIQGLLDATTGQIVVVVGFGHLASMSRSLKDYQGRASFSTSTMWELPTGMILLASARP